MTRGQPCRPLSGTKDNTQQQKKQMQCQTDIYAMEIGIDLDSTRPVACWVMKCEGSSPFDSPRRSQNNRKFQSRLVIIILRKSKFHLQNTQSPFSLPFLSPHPFILPFPSLSLFFPFFILASPSHSIFLHLNN